MILSLLNTSLDDADPEVRFFFLNYLHIYGFGVGVERGVKAMASDLGVSDRLVSKSLRFLESHHYLTRQRLPGRGRPKSVFFSGPRLSDVLSHQSVAVQGDSSCRLIKMCLFDAEGGGSSQEANKLKISERILLCVLLSSADSSGCVSGVGFARLRECTGLTEARLKRHIRALQGAGYIREYTAGGVDKYTSRRVASVYQLDLAFIESRGKGKIKCLNYSHMYISCLDRCVAMCEGLIATHQVEGKAREKFRHEYTAWLSLYHIPYVNPMIVGRLIGLFAKNAKGPLIRNVDRAICALAVRMLINIGIDKSLQEGDWSDEIEIQIISQYIDLGTIFKQDDMKKEALLTLIRMLGKELFKGLQEGLRHVFPEVATIESYFFLPRRAGDDTLSFCFYEKVKDEGAKN